MNSLYLAVVELNPSVRGPPFDTYPPNPYLTPMIQLTDRAASQIRQLTAQGEPNRGLRLFVEKGGCAGSSYAMAISTSEPTDEKCEVNGARLFVAAESAPLLEACTLDYEDELTHTGFKIVNPKAKQTCGCGTSFEA